MSLQIQTLIVQRELNYFLKLGSLCAGIDLPHAHIACLLFYINHHHCH
jgi:hypothetical protein